MLFYDHYSTSHYTDDDVQKHVLTAKFISYCGFKRERILSCIKRTKTN